MRETQVLLGWKAIADVFRVHEKTMQRRKMELEAFGAIFYLNMGCPPRRRVGAFLPALQQWAAYKARRGEML